MVAIELDREQERRLSELAASRGIQLSEIAKIIIEDYLDFQNLRSATDGQWAETSVALAPKVMENENWGEP